MKTLWRIGRGFIVRDLPWSVEQLRKIPPFEFENWAVIALHGVPTKRRSATRGLTAEFTPSRPCRIRSPGAKAGELDFMDDWYPIQVKQKDKAGRPEIDSFEAAMLKFERPIGFFVAFDFSEDARDEIRAFNQRTSRIIFAVTVQDILDGKVDFKLP